MSNNNNNNNNAIICRYKCGIYQHTSTQAKSHAHRHGYTKEIKIEIEVAHVNWRVCIDREGYEVASSNVDTANTMTNNGCSSDAILKSVLCPDNIKEEGLDPNDINHSLPNKGGRQLHGLRRRKVTPVAY